MGIIEACKGLTVDVGITIYFVTIVLVFTAAIMIFISVRQDSDELIRRATRSDKWNRDREAAEESCKYTECSTEWVDSVGHKCKVMIMKPERK